MILADANNFVEQITSDMRNAMKAQDSIKTEVLKSLLARFSNAEAVPVPSNAVQTTTSVVVTGAGVGSTEAARKSLTILELKNIVKEEINELQQIIDQLSQPSDHKNQLARKIDILQRYT